MQRLEQEGIEDLGTQRSNANNIKEIEMKEG